MDFDRLMVVFAGKCGKNGTGGECAGHSIVLVDRRGNGIHDSPVDSGQKSEIQLRRTNTFFSFTICEIDGYSTPF